MTAATVTKPVIVARMGDVCELDPSNALTLEQALANAGTGWDNVTDVRINNLRVTDPKTVLNPGDQVTVLGKIVGA